MNICVGSGNPKKLEAVKRAFLDFKIFEGVAFAPVGSVESGVSDQPVGMEETIQGARNRAERAYSGCELSVGLESGIMPVPLTATGYMNFSACVIHDGRDFFTGLGPAFELPDEVTRLVIEEKLELDEAVLRSGFSDNPRIGYSEGLIGVLTSGAVTRMAYMIPAVSMALAKYLPGSGRLIAR